MANKEQHFEIVNDKGSKIKIEVNKFFDEMVKALKKKSPETIMYLSEQLKDAVDKIKKEREESRPRIGESFNDLFGRRYIVIGKKLNEEKVIVRRGNYQYEVPIKELYTKDGEKKNIPTEIIEDDTVIELKY